MRNLIATATLCLLAIPLNAQEGTGSITGTLDLEPARWVVASRGDGPTSAYSSGDDGTKIRIVGTPEPESDGGPGTLIIEIEAATGAIEPRAKEVRIELKRTDEMVFAEDKNITLTIEALQEAGDGLAIAGSFTATLAPEPQEDVVGDTEDAVTLDGNFQATVPESREE